MMIKFLRTFSTISFLLMSTIHGYTASVIEDFSDGVADNWVSVDGNWSVGSEQFNVTSGTEEASSCYCNAEYSDFVFEARMKKISGNGTDNLGFFFNGDPGSLSSTGNWNSGYKLFFGSGDWQLSRIINGTWTTIQGWKSSSQLNNGFDNWNKLKVSYSSGTINVYINDVLQGTYDDTSLTSGKIGITMYDSGKSGVGAFDDITITDNASKTISWATTSSVLNNGEEYVQLVATRSESTGVATVEFYTTNDTAIAGVDYTATNGTLSFLDGEATVTTIIDLDNDLEPTGAKSFRVILENPLEPYELGGMSEHTVSIIGKRVISENPILCLMEVNGVYQIFSMNPDGSNKLQLTDSVEGNANARWSPDGYSVFFIRSDEVWKMDWNGLNQRYITDGKTLAVSPDGKKLAVSRYGGDFYSGDDLYLYDLLSGTSSLLASLVGADKNADFSPDGTKLVFCNRYVYESIYQNICIVDVSTKSVTSLTHYDGYTTAYPDTPRWSPDGTTIMFKNNGYGQRSFLDTIKADGSGQSGYIGSATAEIYSSIWSPDGQEVIASLDGRGFKADYPYTAGYYITDGNASSRPSDWLRPPASGMLENPSILANGTVQITLSGYEGERFIIQQSSDLTNWVSIVTNTVLENGLMTIEDRENANCRFYRAIRD